MTVAYKYLDKEHFAEALVQSGTVKIGTLFGYAREELPCRSDSEEGTHTITVEQRGVLYDPVTHTTLANNTFQRVTHSQDAYAYCASLELSRSAAAGRESCVRIIDFEAFAECLHWGLQHFHGSPLRRIVRPVLYGSRSSTAPLGPNDIAFLKDAGSFSFEREVRAIFYDPQPPRPYSRLVPPGIVSILASRRLVRHVAIPY
jgi:hypothetical protein